MLSCTVTITTCAFTLITIKLKIHLPYLDSIPNISVFAKSSFSIFLDYKLKRGAVTCSFVFSVALLILSSINKIMYSDTTKKLYLGNVYFLGDSS